MVLIWLQYGDNMVINSDNVVVNGDHMVIICWFMMVIWLQPSGKRLHNYGTSPYLMGKLTIWTGPFSKSSYVSHYHRVYHHIITMLSPYFRHIITIFSPLIIINHHQRFVVCRSWVLSQIVQTTSGVEVQL